ncbi:hypothetical protein IFR05_015422 [Cadophora sp. M221]|nr:hypothetical protein IFR05_015422 [Cadophora sp. M221]
MRFLALQASCLAVWVALLIPVLGNHLPGPPESNNLAPIHAHSTAENLPPIIANDSTQPDGNIHSEEGGKDTDLGGEGESGRVGGEEIDEIKDLSGGIGNTTISADGSKSVSETEPCSASGRGYGIDMAIVSIALLAWEMIEGVLRS